MQVRVEWEGREERNVGKPTLAQLLGEEKYGGGRIVLDKRNRNKSKSPQNNWKVERNKKNARSRTNWFTIGEDRKDIP